MSASVKVDIRATGDYTGGMPRPRSFGLVASTALFTLALLGCENTYPPIPETWVDPPLPTHVPGPLPAASFDGAGAEGSLLASYESRKPRDAEEISTWMLPFQAKTMVVELLIAAAKDDPRLLVPLLGEYARWGAPTRHEPEARPIITKDDPLGEEFLAAFRNAASRFSPKASYSCAPMQPGWQMFVTSGAEPIWCTYSSSDGFDIIGLRLVVEGGAVKTDYVGFFPERPEAPINWYDHGDPPPLTPYLKVPVSLTLPELMPDGSNPVVAKPR